MSLSTKKHKELQDARVSLWQELQNAKTEADRTTLQEAIEEVDRAIRRGVISDFGGTASKVGEISKKLKAIRWPKA